MTDCVVFPFDSMSAAPKSSESTFKRYVEVGRVVLLTDGPCEGKLATIVEIIDHNRVRIIPFRVRCTVLMRRAQALIEGPCTGVPRQSFTYRRLVLTPFVLKKLPRAAGTTTVKKVFEESGVLAKWEKSAWAQRRAAIQKRRSTSDFERFELLLVKKQRRRVRHHHTRSLLAC